MVGGGASLSGFDFEQLRGAGHVVGVNQSMFTAPTNAGVSIDYRFMRERKLELITFAERLPLYLPTRDMWWRLIEPIAGAIYLRDVSRGCTSGYAALSVALLKRARRIVLLGYDYGLSSGRHHYHDAYPWHVPAEQNWSAWAGLYDATAKLCRDRDIEVINASPDSAIKSFPKMSIEEALQWGARS
jgi:hypothetical protein